MKIILASSSPRRKQLLEQAEISFEIVAANIEEIVNTNLSIENIPVEIAYQKALAAKGISNNYNIIIAADTIVALDNEIIGKPKDEADAITILKKLSGKKHSVITGVSIIKDNSEIINFYDITEVEFNILSEQDIRHYVQTYKPYDKAGAYAIQEWIGVVGIKKINGCFYNVMGLPISKVLKYLH